MEDVSMYMYYIAIYSILRPCVLFYGHVVYFYDHLVFNLTFWYVI
jgi:hypothetical protein